MNESEKKERLELLERLSADHILDETTIFKQSQDPWLELDSRTVAIIKQRFRKWHSTWIAPKVVKFLGEPIEDQEKEKCTGNCGMNYCDENGCTDRKRILVNPISNNNEDNENAS
jgi:hypothetical protein